MCFMLLKCNNYLFVFSGCFDTTTCFKIEEKMLMKYVHNVIIILKIVNKNMMIVIIIRYYEPFHDITCPH